MRSLSVITLSGLHLLYMLLACLQPQDTRPWLLRPPMWPSAVRFAAAKRVAVLAMRTHRVLQLAGRFSPLTALVPKTLNALSAPLPNLASKTAQHSNLKRCLFALLP